MATSADVNNTSGPLRNLLETERAKSAIALTTDFLNSERAKNATAFVAGIYGKINAKLPESAQARVAAVEEAVAKRVTTENVDSLIASLDSALTKTAALPDDLRTRARAVSARAVANVDSTVVTQINRLEAVVDKFLPEDAAKDEAAADDNNVAKDEDDDEEDDDKKAIPRVVELSSRISKRLQRRALKNLTMLRERVETVQHIDLIAYAADYLDIDEKEARQRVQNAREAVTVRTAPLVTRVSDTVAGARQLVDTNREVVVKRVRAFYTVLVVEYLGLVEKGAAARKDTAAFVASVRTALGSAWSDKLAGPTATYFEYIASEWAATAEDDKDEDGAKEEEGEEDATVNTECKESESQSERLSASARRTAAKAQRRLRHVERFLRVMTPKVNAALGDAASTVLDNVRSLSAAQLQRFGVGGGEERNEDTPKEVEPTEPTEDAAPFAEDEVTAKVADDEDDVVETPQADTEDDEDL